MKEKILIFLNIIKRVFGVLSKSQKRKSIIVFAAIIIASVFEMLGVTAIIPFVTAVVNVDSFLKNSYIIFWMEKLSLNNSNYIFILLSIMLIVVYLVKNIVLLVSRHIQNWYQCRLQQELSTLMLSSYMKRPYEFFVNTNSSQIYRGIDKDIIGYFETLKNIFSLFAEMITMALILFFIFITNLSIALGIICVAFICVVVVVFGCKNAAGTAGENCRRADAKKIQYAHQAVDGVKEIFVMQRKKYFVKAYGEAYNDYRKALMSYYFIALLPERIIEVALVSGIIMIVAGSVLSGYNSEQYIPQLAAIAVACFRLLPSLSKITASITQIIYYRPTIEAVYDNVIEAKRIDSQNEIDTNNVILNFTDKLTIDHVSWKYENSDNYVINNLCVEIKKDSSTAFIGESGAGKSTLADIIMGLLQPQRGSIKVDETDIHSNLKQWAHMIGYVPQSVYLIDDTIRNNIAFGVDEGQIVDDNIWKALGQAQLDKFVKDLPEGLDTMVGERGIRFSGGQKQRIAIARALYYNPEILVLDEATSALDNETEKAVMEAIESLQGHKTIIIIAHRLTTIKNCDEVYEIKNGKAYLKNKKELL